MRLSIKIIRNLFLGLLVALILLMGATFLPLSGKFKVYTVQSGSMAPAIPLGSLIFTKTAKDYSVGDVVTRKTDDPKMFITHRIVSIKNEGGQTIFETKGDANDSPDGETFTKEQITGKVIFTVPYLGYPIGFARTTPGMIALIIIPGSIIVYEELKNIKKEIVAVWKKRKEGRKTRKGAVTFEDEFTRNSRTSSFDEGNIIVRNIDREPKNIRKRRMDL
jgi:signal peptidase